MSSVKSRVTSTGSDSKKAQPCRNGCGTRVGKVGQRCWQCYVRDVKNTAKPQQESRCLAGCGTLVTKPLARCRPCYLAQSATTPKKLRVKPARPTTLPKPSPKPPVIKQPHSTFKTSGICSYGSQTGVSANARKACKRRTNQDSIYCMEHRQQAWERLLDWDRDHGIDVPTPVWLQT